MEPSVARQLWGVDEVRVAQRRSRELLDVLRPGFERRAEEMGIEQLVLWSKSLPPEHRQAVIRLVLEEWDLPPGESAERDPDRTLVAAVRLVKLPEPLRDPPVSRGRAQPPDRERLVAEAAAKPVHFFLQLDGFADLEPDHLFGPDEDGDALFATHSWELSRTGLPVRVRVHEGTTKETALRLLRKLTALLERDWAQVYEGPPRPL